MASRWRTSDAIEHGHGHRPVGGDDRVQPDLGPVGEHPDQRLPDRGAREVGVLGGEGAPPVDHRDDRRLGPGGGEAHRPAPVELGPQEADQAGLALALARQHHPADVRQRGEGLQLAGAEVEERRRAGRRAVRCRASSGHARQRGRGAAAADAVDEQVAVAGPPARPGTASGRRGRRPGPAAPSTGRRRAWPARPASIDRRRGRPRRAAGRATAAGAAGRPLRANASPIVADEHGQFGLGLAVGVDRRRDGGRARSAARRGGRPGLGAVDEGRDVDGGDRRPRCGRRSTGPSGWRPPRRGRAARRPGPAPCGGWRRRRARR